MLVWVALRAPSLSVLLALKAPDRREKVSLLMLNLIPLCSVLLSYAGYLWLPAQELWTAAPWNIGPVVSRAITIALFINMAAMATALYRSMRYSPYFISAFIHTAGAVGFLLLFSRILHTLSTTVEMRRILISYTLPYLAGAFLTLLTLMLVSTFRKRGTAIWMPK